MKGELLLSQLPPRGEKEAFSTSLRGTRLKLERSIDALAFFNYCACLLCPTLHPPLDHQSVCALVHNFFENKCPAYMSDMFHPKSIKVQTRNSILQLSKPSSKASGHKGIAYLAPSIWNELPSDMKLIPNLNTFKHKLKKWFLENLKKEEQNIYTN